MDRWDELLEAINIEHNCFAKGWPRKDAVIKVGEELPLLYITKADGAEACHLEMIKLMGGTGFEVFVEYHSLYGDVSSVLESTRVKSKTVEELYRALSGK
ncbi:hypothetical protein [Azohydromonas australica]|uniref:hypothetical protein n=1 Tax=Azohydromonas australica TaxID=364039 RepID=UPI0012EC63C8|nr:hypothetical protein [Azohydromonas australica]